jgi:hypothetical protein
MTMTLTSNTDLWSVHQIEHDLIAQARRAQEDIAHCQRLRATLMAEKRRKALRQFEEAQIDELVRCCRLFKESAGRALIAVSRFAAGARYQVERWEFLKQRLVETGSWCGRDKHESINLRGLSSYVDDLYLNEAAYLHWVDTMAAQENPKQADIDIILRKEVMPKRLQDMDIKVWRPDPEEARARLHAIVDEELPKDRELAERLRVEDEEPARAAAVDRALARVDPEEIQLVRALRSHEKSYEQATRALVKLRGAGGVARGANKDAESRREAPAELVALPPLETPPPARELVGYSPRFVRGGRAA